MKTYFVSDAHLGSLALKDKHRNEKLLVRWMDEIQSDCEALYLLGDMIDFWYEYRRVVPKGYARFFGKLAAFTDAGIPVYWFAGNHDIWLFDYVQQELGVQVIQGSVTKTIRNKTFFLSHGDGLGDPSVLFRMLRSIFHARICQRLFSLFHPDIAMSFGLNWARHSRLKREDNPETYLGEDQEYLIRYVKNDIREKGSDAPDFYVFGHRHIVLDLQLSVKSRIVILGDWFRHFTFASFDGEFLDLMNYETEKDS